MIQTYKVIKNNLILYIYYILIVFFYKVTKNITMDFQSIDEEESETLVCI